MLNSRVGEPRPAPVNPFLPSRALHPPGVVDKANMAMDEASFAPISQWGFNALDAVGHEGQGFLGYPILAELAQRSEYRKIVGIIAEEMTRRWIKIQAANPDTDKTDKIAELEAAMDTFKVRDRFREATEHDGYFGRGHIFIDLGNASPGELKTSIGDGKDAASKAKLKKGCLQGLRCVEPIWVSSTAVESNNPLKPDFYKPVSWNVFGNTVDGSRLLTIVAREVPDIFKPAYSFGGLSLTQIAKPYVDNWLRTRQSVSDAVYKFSLDLFGTNMTDVLSGGGGHQLFRRLALMQKTRDVNSVFAFDKEAESFDTVTKQLGTLDKLQAQAQEQMAAVAGIPLVKLLGITPSGLNASSDGEIRCFYDTIHAAQERLYSIPLDRIFALLQIHLFGEVDPDLTYRFEPLWSLSEKEMAEVNKIEAETDAGLVDAGVITALEARKRIAADPDTPYSGLVPDDLPELPDAESALDPSPTRPEGFSSGADE